MAPRPVGDETVDHPPSSLTAVGVDIFAGGFTLGVERHFRVRAHLEHGPYGVATFKLNRPHVPVFHGKDKWPRESFRDVDFMYANPPCAVVSVCGGSVRRGGDSWRTDPRVQCIRDVVDLACEARPKVLALESVTQLRTRAGELVNEQVAKLLEAGYSVTHLLVNTGWHGSPNLRKRYFLTAHRVPLSLERLNYAPPDTVGHILGTVSDPGWVPPTRPDHARLYDLMAPGVKLRTAWERAHPEATWTRNSDGGVVGRPRFAEYRLDAAAPMAVFYGDFYWHPTEPRRIGLNEAKALCGFPDDFQFHQPGPAYSEMARGVMPAMADWLARQVAASLRGERRGTVLEPGSRVHIHDIRKEPT